MLKITRDNRHYIAEYKTDDSAETPILIGPCSETELKHELRSFGIDQRDIEQAFFNSQTSYFGVGKW